MAKTSYPYKAWVLTPSFLVKQVEFTKPSYYNTCDSLASGKEYRKDEQFAGRNTAMTYGRKLIEQRRARLEKAHANLAKHEANLNK